MNEVQALNILTNLANEAQANGVFKDINESGAVYTALVVLSQHLPQPEAPENQAGYVEPMESQVTQETVQQGDPQNIG